LFCKKGYNIETIISEQSEFEGLIDTLKEQEVLAIDTEFIRDTSYDAKLCLIQIATESFEVIVDPLALDDLCPLADVLSNEDILKVFHSGFQDIQTLYQSTGVIAKPVFDTQIAASVLGRPYQVAYANLVYDYCDVELAKTSSLSDWARRPLSDKQILYALEDVRYLLPVYEGLASDLKSLSREEWIRPELDELSSIGKYEEDIEEAYKKVKKSNGLSRKSLAALRELAKWRDSAAREQGIIVKRVLSDEFLVEISKRIPKNVDELCSIRGVKNRLSKQRLEEVVEALARIEKMDPEEYPKKLKGSKSGENIELLVDFMMLLVKARAKEHKIAYTLLASKKELIEIAKGNKNEAKVLEGWRAEIVGNELIELLSGKINVSVEDDSIKIQ
jgi:ribonuclease D